MGEEVRKDGRLVVVPLPISFCSRLSRELGVIKHSELQDCLGKVFF